MDALAHRLESIFQTTPRSAPPQWHKNLVTALLGSSGGIGGAAIDARGNRVIVEPRRRRYGDCYDLVVRRLDPFGGERDATPIVVARRLRADLVVNPKVGLGPEGHFVVAWEDPDTNSIMARRYAPIGAPLGPAMVVNSGTVQVPRLNPLLAVNATGAFIVLWEHAWTSIRARLYGPTGSAFGDEIEVCLTQHLRA